MRVVDGIGPRLGLQAQPGKRHDRRGPWFFAVAGSVKVLAGVQLHARLVRVHIEFTGTIRKTARTNKQQQHRNEKRKRTYRMIRYVSGVFSPSFSTECTS